MTIRTTENRQLQTMNERRTVNFALRDRKRRWVGAQIATWAAVMETNEGFMGRCPLPPGPAFGLNCMATRDGHPYGASQPSQWFATVEERDAAIAAYLDGARKRAAKNREFTAF